jgi:hypothetical protein
MWWVMLSIIPRPVRLSIPSYAGVPSKSTVNSVNFSEHCSQFAGLTVFKWRGVNICTREQMFICSSQLTYPIMSSWVWGHHVPEQLHQSHPSLTHPLPTPGQHDEHSRGRGLTPALPAPNGSRGMVYDPLGAGRGDEGVRFPFRRWQSAALSAVDLSPRSPRH